MGNKDWLFLRWPRRNVLDPVLLPFPRGELRPMYRLTVQTKGRTYAEIDELYASGVPVRKFASARTAAQGVLERDMSNA